MNNAVIIKDLVLIGGGHAHVEVIRHFAMSPLQGLRITVISKDLYAPYSGMVPGLIAGHYEFDDCHIDLRRLAEYAGARLYVDEAISIDLEKKEVICRDRPPVCYDVLSVNIGSTPITNCTFSPDASILAVKPIPQFLDDWQQLRERVLRDDRITNIAVVGGGAGGVEVALATQFHLRSLIKESTFPSKQVNYHLFTDKEQILTTHNQSVRERFKRILNERNIAAHLGHKVVAVQADKVIDDAGHSTPVDHVIWVTSASAASWLADTGLAISDRGFIRVNASLQSVSHPDVFAVGDIADVSEYPRPKSGVFAVRQGKPLAENIRRSLHSQVLKPFRPQRSFLSLISTGDKFAVASRGTLGWAVAGRSVWALKNWIDQRFMQRYNELPQATMRPRPSSGGDALVDDTQALSQDDMRCGGCGAKVGSSVLTRVLKRLNLPQAGNTLLAAHCADDAAVINVEPGQLLVQSVDHFRAFIDDPYVFGQIAANHSLGDVFAMGAQPHSALAIVTVPYGLETKLEQQLYEMLAGADKVMSLAGAGISGGHTGEGAETSLGFAVNGTADAQALLTKSGMAAGEALILTKPLGTGALLAANMRIKAKGRWVQQSIQAMLQSSADAATILQQHGASACTDITGFGLAGHLLEMVADSKISVRINLAALPVLDGALESMALGIFSSLHEQNARAIKSIAEGERLSENLRLQIMFDPQTCGGLLASVNASNAERCIEQLQVAGYKDAVIIGSVVPVAECVSAISIEMA